MNKSPLIYLVLFFFLSACTKKTGLALDSKEFNTNAIISEANDYMNYTPITITASKAPNSEGGLHDYFSEGPYWWTNPEDPNGPYIRRDGERNPKNFAGHERALKKFEQAVTSLTAAYLLTNDTKYANRVQEHLKAWFINSDTKMNPHLLYAQAIKGINSGRGIGIIDGICFIKVVNAITVLNEKGLVPSADLNTYKTWFDSFTNWLTTHQYGIDEMNNNNNHSTWWGAQVLTYSIFTNNAVAKKIAIDQFKKQLAIQMKDDGSFPDELGRTRPFHYTNYNLEAWADYGISAQADGLDLWNYQSKMGGVKKSFDFSYTYHMKPNDWPYKTDVEKKVEPHAEDFFYIAAKGFKDQNYLKLWQSLLPKGGSTSATLVVVKARYNI
jgi:hypothetical protein